MQKVLILLASPEDESLTTEGQNLLRDFSLSYQLRVGSAQVSPDFVREIVTSFHKDGGQVIICVGAPQDQLACLASSSSSLPVLNVLVSSHPVSLMSGAAPVATMGLGSEGFTKATLFALQTLALADAELSQNVQRHRHSLAARVIAADHKHRVIFDV